MSTNPDKILQTYVGRTQISRVTILAPSDKGAQNSGEKVGVFCKVYNELAFLCNGTDRHETRAKSQSVSSVEP